MTTPTKNFGFSNTQNISPFSYPLNTSHISDLYNLTIPQKLPEVRIADDDDDDNGEDAIIITKNGVVDRDWVSNILLQLDNLLKQIPIYPMPPLLNVYHNSNNNNNKRVNANVSEIVNNNNNFGNDLFLGQPKKGPQQQNPPPPPSSSV